MNDGGLQKRALLIGINYLKSKTERLFGCINDVVNMRTMLMRRFGYTAYDIITLRDDSRYMMPTRNNIMRGLYRIAEISTPTSETVIHYSGHGSFIRDRNGDEPDGMDEVIVPVDYKIITDDELFSIISKIKGKVLLFFDSCHSGSVCDLQYSQEYNNGLLIKKINNKKHLSNPNIIMMSGCKDSQTSADTYNAESRQSIGAFTDNLVNVLSSTSYPIDMINVYKSVCDRVSLSGYTQSPVFSSSNEQTQYFYRNITTHVNTSLSARTQQRQKNRSLSNYNIIKSSFINIISTKAVSH